MMSPSLVARMAAAAYAASCLVFCEPSWGDTGFEITGKAPEAKLTRCPQNRNCVSSNYLEPPNRYMSPLKTMNDRDKAFQRAVRDLNGYMTAGPGGSDITIAEVKPDQYYIHLTVPGTAPGSIDDIELLFSIANSVNVRCDARVTLPAPPFCVKRNCINGNMDQRSRVERVALILNLPPSDQQQMQKAKWTPIFFNSDRVPGFDDDTEDDY